MLLVLFVRTVRSCNYLHCGSTSMNFTVTLVKVYTQSSLHLPDHQIVAHHNVLAGP